MDYNATCPVRPTVAQAMYQALVDGGNPSSVHADGRRARAAVEKARAQVAATVNCRPQQVVFTSGGTEANNAVVHGFADRPLFVGATEHESVLTPAMARVGGAQRIPVSADGRLEAEVLSEALAADGRPALVSIMMANNETGVINDVAGLAALAHQNGALMHCDATQALGKMPVDFADLGVDLMTVSAHKIGGPQGIGALVLREGVPMAARQSGGGQELGRRAGTENVAGIIGFGLACEEAAAEIEHFASLARLRHKLEKGARQTAPDVMLVGQDAPRLANTSCLCLPGVSGETQVMHFDLAGISLSSGSACSSGKVRQSHVLLAMGLDEGQAGCAIRVSLGRQTRAGDVDRFLEAWKKLVDRVGRAGAA